MHTVVVSPYYVVFIDKVEQNPLKKADGTSAIFAQFNWKTGELTALETVTDTFCSAGAFLANGSMISGGGGEPAVPYVEGGNTIRTYEPDYGTVYENIGAMSSLRWYPTMLTMPDGRVLIMGGSTKATGVNRAEINVPNYEFYPTADGGKAVPVPFQFLTDTLIYNLYPMMHIVPNAEGKSIIFIFANKKSIIYDLDNAVVVKALPDITGVSPRIYPLTATSVMLPLKVATLFAPEIMICGGGTELKPNAPTEATCGRIKLNDAEPVWEMDDFGGIGRVMPDAVILPSSDILYINGANLGYAGYRKGPKDNPIYVHEDPVFTPVLYNVDAKTYRTLAASTIPRMYHSTATMIPNGQVLVSGSNPQGSQTLGTKYPTEYRIELFTPPELQTQKPRPTIVNIGGNPINTVKHLVYYKQIVDVTITLTATAFDKTLLKGALMNFGFITHSQHMSQRYVEVVISSVTPPADATSTTYALTVDMPSDGTILPPGPNWLTILYDGVTCDFMGKLLVDMLEAAAIPGIVEIVVVLVPIYVAAVALIIVVYSAFSSTIGRILGLVDFLGFEIVAHASVVALKIAADLIMVALFL
ncbi:12187_t:CDS:2, partial [Entrophospora sp. SA101]